MKEKEFNKLIVYVCLMTIAMIVALPATITGEIDILIITTLSALIVTLIYDKIIMKDEDIDD